MSLLTHASVVVSYCARATKEALTEPIPGDTRGQALASLQPLNTDLAGGSKVYCEDVLAACFNYVLPLEVIEWFVGLPWSTADDATLVVSGEDSAVRVVVVESGRVVVRHDPTAAVGGWGEA